MEEIARLCRKEAWVRLHSRAKRWVDEDPEQPLWRWARAWAEIHGASALPDGDRDRAFGELRRAVDDGARPALDGVAFPFDVFAEADDDRRRAKLDAYEAVMRARALGARSQWKRGLAACREAAALVPDYRLPWDMMHGFASTAGDAEALAEAKAAIDKLR